MSPNLVGWRKMISSYDFIYPYFGEKRHVTDYDIDSNVRLLTGYEENVQFPL